MKIALIAFAGSLAVLPWVASACSRTPTAPAVAPAPGAQSNGKKELAIEAPPVGGLKIVNAADPNQPWRFDMGHIAYGSVGETKVVMENTENRPLVVHNLKPGCSCTTPEISYVDSKGERVLGNAREDPVITLPPGVRAEVILRVDTTIVPMQNAEKLVRVVSTSDSATNPYVQIEVHMFVELPFQAVPGMIRLGEVPQSQGAHGETKIVSLNDDGERLTDVVATPPGVTAKLVVDPNSIHDQWTLAVDLTPPVELGMFERTVEIGATGPKGEGKGRNLSIKIAAIGVHDVTVDPDRLVFNTREVGAKAEVDLAARLAGQRLSITGVELDAVARDRFKAEFEAIGPDDRGRSARWKVRLIAVQAIPSGPFGGKVVIVTDDSSTPRVEVPYLALSRS